MNTPTGYYKLESDRPKVGQEIKASNHRKWREFFGPKSMWGFPIFNEPISIKNINRLFTSIDVSSSSDLTATVHYSVHDDIADVPPPHFCVHEVTFAKSSLKDRIKAYIWPRNE